MHVLHEKPPLFDKIAAKFNLEGYSAIFAWGNTIYQPFSTDDLAPELIAHERVHGLRQLQLDKLQHPHLSDDGRIVYWWERYIDDHEFRLAEELPAHRAELGVLHMQGPQRNQRRLDLNYVATRLCYDLYAWPPGFIDIRRAKRLLKEEF